MLKLSRCFLFLIALLFIASCKNESKGKHLFILSGQSNMSRLDLRLSFIPKIEEKFGKDNVIFVKLAMGGQPMSRWDKNWNNLSKNKCNEPGDLYTLLIQKVKGYSYNMRVESTTFIWVHGETDAKEENADVYKESLLRLYNQFSEDLNRSDINYVIGRLSDFDLNNEIFPDWTRIRNIQVEVAESNPRFDWVDTDDYNTGVNRNGKPIEDDLHMSVKGYEQMGSALAEKAIQLIEANR